jgi:hypothetical protein
MTDDWNEALKRFDELTVKRRERAKENDEKAQQASERPRNGIPVRTNRLAKRGRGNTRPFLSTRSAVG